jgi:hypothetical protein
VTSSTLGLGALYDGGSCVCVARRFETLWQQDNAPRRACQHVQGKRVLIQDTLSGTYCMHLNGFEPVPRASSKTMRRKADGPVMG